MSFDSAKAIAACRREASLCRKHLAKGSPPRFWRRRLEAAAKQLEAAAAILRMQIVAIDRDYRERLYGSDDKVVKP